MCSEAMMKDSKYAAEGINWLIHNTKQGKPGKNGEWMIDRYKDAEKITNRIGAEEEQHEKLKSGARKYSMQITKQAKISVVLLKEAACVHLMEKQV